MTVFSGLKIGLITAVGFVGVASADPVRIVTDLPALASLATQIVGPENGEVSSLLSRGDDVHYFAMRPSQAHDMSQADIVVWIGPALTPWLSKAADALNETGLVTPLETDEAAHDHGHGDEDEEGDPHLWLDPQEMQHWAETIASQLDQIRPEWAAQTAQRLDATLAEMESIEQDVAAILKPVLGMPYVAMHDAYRIFSERFGLQIVANLTPHDDAAPSARQVSDMRKTIGSLSSVCLLSGVGASPQLIETVVEGYNVGVAVVDIIGVDGTASGYRDMMITLATGIADCAKERS